jgi:histidyl-tRNA synthetase
MTAEKGLDAATADKIGEYVKHKGTPHFVFPSAVPDVLQGDQNF